MSGHADHPDRREGGPIPRELVDAFFDRELDEGSREQFFRAAMNDAGACEHILRTQRIISALREPIESPDLAPRILSRLDERRRFVPASLRRLITGGRTAVAAGLLLGLAAIALIQRAAPDGLSLTPAGRPLSRIVDSGARDAAAGVQQLAGAVESVASRLGSPAAPDELARRPRIVQIGPLAAGPNSVRVLVRPQSDLLIHGGAGPGVRSWFAATPAMTEQPLFRPDLAEMIDWSNHPGQVLRVPAIAPGGRIDLIRIPGAP